MHESEASPSARPSSFGDRYRVEQLLGRGGMAEVYRVYDSSTQRSVALKRLTPHSPAQFGSHVTQLFEQEFQTLSELVHPRIIAAYDYQRDASGPYYTMELLDGGDLRKLSPLPYLRAIQLLCDVCSALSLLHSRQLLHRDLTPLNIRCTHDGNAKLFDFGSMAKMGVSKHIVGTPPFVAPEALAGQALDARTDLFALGATAYFALTGRHAYPARRLSALDEFWRAGLIPPSRLVNDLPPALDDLIISLLQLSPSHRPSNAAEVMERLSAIGGFALDESLRVQRAHLTTPSLVGRNDTLRRARKHLLRAQRGRGGALNVLGERGVGRSRFLDACALEAKLSGALVLRAHGRDNSASKWSGARALLEQLTAAAPELAQRSLLPHAAVLAHMAEDVLETLRTQRTESSSSMSSSTSLPPSMPSVAPGPSESASAPLPQGPIELRATVQTALRTAILNVAKRRMVLIAVDDVAQLDEPSAALVSLLAHEAREHALLVIAADELELVDPANKPAALLRSLGDAVRLSTLTPAETKQLLSSLFGDVPNVHLLADRFHAAASGNPGVLMQMAQQLVDRGLVRYQGGAFILPGGIDVSRLSASLSEQLSKRCEALSPSALALAQAAAVCGVNTLGFDDYLRLTEHADPGQLQRELQELCGSGVFDSAEQRYFIAQPEIERVLLGTLTGSDAPLLERRAALLFEQRTEHFRAAQHWLHAGEMERACDLLVAHLSATRNGRLQDPAMLFEHVQTLPKQWPQTLRTLIRVCDRLKRPLREGFVLRSTLVAYSTLTGHGDLDELRAIVAQLKHDAGLDLYEALSSEPPETRLSTALTRAVARYAEGQNPACVLAPVAAIRQLAQVSLQAISIATRALDYDLLASMPSLAPFAPLSAALDVVQKDVEASLHVLAGRYDLARQGYREVLQRIEQPDHAGLELSYYTYLRLALIMGLGQLEAAHGLPVTENWAAALEQHPLFEVTAWRVRVLEALVLGDLPKAEEYRAAAERLQIQNRPAQLFKGLHLWSLMVGHSEADDLLGVKQYAVEIEAMAQAFPQWQPSLDFARGCYQALRGDHGSACEHFERVLGTSTPGRHTVWPLAAARLLQALLQLGRHEEIVARAQPMLETLRAHALTQQINMVLAPLAQAEAALGDHVSATQHIESALRDLDARGTRGIRMGFAYEARARVALAARDEAAFETYAALCEEQYRVARNASLLARHKRLLRDANEYGLASQLGAELTVTRTRDTEPADASLLTLLSSCQGPNERAEQALHLIVEQSQSCAGYLYTLQRTGPVLVAREGHASPPPDLDKLVAAHLSAAMSEDADLDATTYAANARPAADGVDASWRGFTPLLLRHPSNDQINVTGLAVVLPSRPRAHRVPHRLLQALSKALHETGDVTTAGEAAWDSVLQMPPLAGRQPS